MESVAGSAHLVPVDDDEGRGAAIARRRKSLGIKSQHEFARWIAEQAESTGRSHVPRETINKAEKDAPGVEDATFERIEWWLDYFQKSTEGIEDESEPAEASPPNFVTFEIKGVFGAESVTVKGPVANLSELESAVERLLRGQRDQ